MADGKHDAHSRLFQRVREIQDDELGLAVPGEHARARARLLAAIDCEPRGAAAQQPKPANPGWRWAFGTLAAAACALAIFIGWPRDRALQFEVDGSSVAIGDASEWIVASTKSRVLRFSDSTQIELAPQGRMRVNDLRRNGARVELGSGEVQLAVHHGPDTSWRVVAGPYTVHVTGTRFRVAWEPSRERFEVSVKEGSVRVDGPADEVARLRAGDSLVRARGKATADPEILELADPPASQLADAAELGLGLGESAAVEPAMDAQVIANQVADELASPEQASTTVRARARVPSKAEAEPQPKALGWAELYDQAQYAAAWSALEGLPGGILGESERVGADAMLDLADLARVNKRSQDSRKVLEQLRVRFPDGRQAGEAAFLLGKMSADAGAHAKAVVWLERYVSERPQGPWAKDALARLMHSYGALGRDAEAASAAERYLSRKQEGPNADKAREILGE